MPHTTSLSKPNLATLTWLTTTALAPIVRLPAALFALVYDHLTPNQLLATLAHTWRAIRAPLLAPLAPGTCPHQHTLWLQHVRLSAGSTVTLAACLARSAPRPPGRHAHGVVSRAPSSAGYCAHVETLRVAGARLGTRGAPRSREDVIGAYQSAVFAVRRDGCTASTTCACTTRWPSQRRAACSLSRRCTATVAGRPSLCAHLARQGSSAGQQVSRPLVRTGRGGCSVDLRPSDGVAEQQPARGALGERPLSARTTTVGARPRRRRHWYDEGCCPRPHRYWLRTAQPHAPPPLSPADRRDGGGEER